MVVKMVVGGKKRPKADFPPTFHHHGEKAAAQQPEPYYPRLLPRSKIGRTAETRKALVLLSSQWSLAEFHG